MGLLRLTAIVAVGVALLPSDREKQAVLYTRAASATQWTMTFCDRNASTCSQASTAWQTFLAKAEFGARLAYDMARDGEAPLKNEEAIISTSSIERTGTLTDADLQPAWHGKSAAKKGG